MMKKETKQRLFFTKNSLVYRNNLFFNLDIPKIFHINYLLDQNTKTRDRDNFMV